MDFTELRKGFLKLFIGFLGITALVAIASVISGELGSLQAKVLFTCFTISAASICAMACAAFIERRRKSAPGIAGILFSVLSAFLVIVGIWMESGDEMYWKITLTFISLAIGFAHAFLLSLPDLDKKHLWVQPAALISISLLVLSILIVIWGEVETQWFYRFLTVVAILTGLVTLVIPILMKLRTDTGDEEELLLLKRLDSGEYQDSSGNIYRVEKQDPVISGASEPEQENQSSPPTK